VEPVKLMPFTSGFSISSSPISTTLSREQVMTLNTPAGTPGFLQHLGKNSPPR
jgi:hypothetical protein